MHDRLRSNPVWDGEACAIGNYRLAGPGNFRLVKVDGDEEIPKSVANREFTGDLILNSTIFRDVRIIGAIL
ncbi:MAG TPA: hypothetical protein VGV68_04410 [Terriglobia bacterium]|nr:hypothetical protein [Terriglobia bacterium]